MRDHEAFLEGLTVDPNVCVSPRIKEALKQVLADLSANRERAGRLARAISPLAAWHLYDDEHERPDLAIAVRGTHSRITVGDVLAAREAMNPPTASAEEQPPC